MQKYVGSVKRGWVTGGAAMIIHPEAKHQQRAQVADESPQGSGDIGIEV